MLDEFFEEAKRELLANQIRHQERAALRFGHALHSPGEQRLHLWLREMTGELFPERNVAALREIEDLSREHALRDELRFLAQGKLGRIAPFHEAREHRLHERRGRSELLVEAVLHETGERVVEAVREGEGSPAVAFRGAGAVADVREKLRRLIWRAEFP